MGAGRPGEKGHHLSRANRDAAAMGGGIGQMTRGHCLQSDYLCNQELSPQLLLATLRFWHIETECHYAAEVNLKRKSFSILALRL